MADFISYDGKFSDDYSYRRYRYETLGTKLGGYEYERYDGTDAEDPFRVEGAQEMREKPDDNAALASPYDKARAAAEQRADAPFDKVETGPVGRYVPPQKRSRGRLVAARRLDLHLILRDADIQRKYKFDARTVSTLHAIREDSAVDAAGHAQQHLIDHGFTSTEVTVEKDFSFTRGQAAAELSYYAAICPLKKGIIETKTVITPFATMLHFLPAEFSRDSAHDMDWEVICPLSRAIAGVNYFKIVSHYGYEEAHAMAGVAALTLGITVNHSSFGKLMCHPTVTLHAAADPPSKFDTSRFFPTTEAEALIVSRAITPVLLRGTHHAFTVGIVGTGRLLNEHVRQRGASVKYCNKELRKFQTYRLKGNLWCFYDTVNLGKQECMARYRSPKIGEVVRMVLREGAVTYLGPPGVIRAGYEGTMSVEVEDTSFAVCGMSGLPYVGKDGLVVAIHEGIALNALRVLPVPDHVGMDIPVEEAMTCQLSYGPPGTTNVSCVEFDLRKPARGFRANLEAACRSLDNDGDRTLLTMHGKRAYVAKQSGDHEIPGFKFKLTSTGAAGQPGSVPTRAPVLGESVVILGKTCDGIYVSPVVSISSELPGLVAVDVAKLPDVHKDFFNGALLLGLDDAMVVGVISSQGIRPYGPTDFNLMCWAAHDIGAFASDGFKDVTSCAMGVSESVSSGMFTFSDSERTTYGPDTVLSVRGMLTELLPGFDWMNTSLYPDDWVDEIVSHPSLEKYRVSKTPVFSANKYWARMGDAALSYRIMLDMRDKLVADIQATVIKGRVQSNTRQAEIARRLNLDKLIRFRKGTIISEHNLADLLEAIFGLVVHCTGMMSTSTAKLYDLFEMGCPSGFG